MSNKPIEQQLMVINGNLTPSRNGRFFRVENPSKRGSIIAEVPSGDEKDVDIAVRAASCAFTQWRLTSPLERTNALMNIAKEIEAQTDDLAKTLAMESGNAIRTQARPEISFSAVMCRYFAGLSSEVKGGTYPAGNDTFAYTWREPIGVVGCLIPWNAPVVLAVAKLAPAIVTGNTAVIKAASDAPLAVLKIGKIFARHLPPGVVNFLTGPGSSCGEALTRHPLVGKLSFTGSTEVGKGIMRNAADKIVPVSMELGGKSPQIVYPDAMSEKTVQGVIDAMRFSRQGQSCTAGSRLFLHKDIFDPFVEKLIGKLRAMKVGEPCNEDTDMGAIVSKYQFDQVCSYISDGMNSTEANLLLGGLPPEQGPLSEGYYVEPTVFACNDNQWRLAKEEIFGPVLVIIPWEDEEDVIRMANDTHYGLAAFIWSADTARGMLTARALEAGWIQINRGSGQLSGHPYGGVKQSGFGREYCLEGMLESFTQTKSVILNLNS